MNPTGPTGPTPGWVRWCPALRFSSAWCREPRNRAPTAGISAGVFFGLSQLEATGGLAAWQLFVSFLVEETWRFLVGLVICSSTRAIC